MGLASRTGPFNAAAEIFGVDDPVLNKTPRLKYNFSIEFILNENVVAPQVQQRNFVFNRVVSVGLPDVDYGITQLNQYNRVRHIPTRMSTGTVPIVFYDTKDNEFQNLMKAYAGHYFHGHELDTVNFNSYDVLGQTFASGAGHGFGAKSIAQDSRFFFEQININSRETAAGGRSIQLFNCMITNIQHDTLAYSDSQPVTYSVTFQPEHFNIDADAGSSNEANVERANIASTQNQQAVNRPAQAPQQQGLKPFTGTLRSGEKLRNIDGKSFVVPAE